MTKKVKNDITGQRFSRLLAVKFVPDNSDISKFMCICDCGLEKVIHAQSLIRGLTKSCGCLQKELAANRNTTHGQSGLSRSKTYNSWAGMMDRGEWGGHPSYSRYGAVGIRVDKRWHKFENFYSDMGERPNGASIDRIDNSKGYSLLNCRWANRRDQSLNRSNTKKIIYKEEVMPVFILCENLGISHSAFRSRTVRRKGDFVLAFKSIGIDVIACD